MREGEARARSLLGLGALAAAVGLLLACAAGPAHPPEVRWGTDECSHCHMIVGEPRFAAVARDAAGAEARFDDLGCMLRWLADGDEAAWRIWSHDAGGPNWLPAASAWYTREPPVATPMGSGLGAWSTHAAAVESGGAPLGWQQLRASVAGKLNNSRRRPRWRLLARRVGKVSIRQLASFSSYCRLLLALPLVLAAGCGDGGGGGAASSEQVPSVPSTSSPPAPPATARTPTACPSSARACA